MKLISNGFEYKVTTEEATLYYSENSNSVAKKVTKKRYSEIINTILCDGNSLDFESQGDCFYYSFYPLDGLEKNIRVRIGTNKMIKKEFVKWRLYSSLKDKYIIDFTKFGSDISIYRKNPQSQWNGWDSYSSYNLIIRDWEIHLSIGS